MNQEIETIIRSYKFTVTALCVAIIVIFCIFIYVVWFMVPDVIAGVLKPTVVEAVDAAFADYELAE